MFFPRISVDDHIFNVGLTNFKVCNDFVNKMPERSRRIFHTKRHNFGHIVKHGVEWSGVEWSGVDL